MNILCWDGFSFICETSKTVNAQSVEEWLKSKKTIYFNISDTLMRNC